MQIISSVFNRISLFTIFSLDRETRGKTVAGIKTRKKGRVGIKKNKRMADNEINRQISMSIFLLLLKSIHVVKIATGPNNADRLRGKVTGKTISAKPNGPPPLVITFTVVGITVNAEIRTWARADAIKRRLILYLLNG